MRSPTPVAESGFCPVISRPSRTTWHWNGTTFEIETAPWFEPGRGGFPNGVQAEH